MPQQISIRARTYPSSGQEKFLSRTKNFLHQSTSLWLVLALSLVVSSCQAEVPYQLQTVATDLEKPWSLALLPGGGYLVTELPGRLRHISAEGQLSEPLSGVPEVYYAGQGGLFDVVLHPGFADNSLVYLSFAEGTPKDNGTAIARGRLTETGLQDVEIIFRLQTRKDTPVHYGGRMAFLVDGSLLLTTGDGFNYREAAQDVNSQLGKLLRLTDTGQPASGNPFADAPYVYSYGHRNPQGLAVAADGTIWLHEHGPKGGDEVNRIEAGMNYGWPAITFGLDYSGAIISPHTTWPGMEQPEHYWVPSIAPSGLAIYDGAMFPEWSGDLFIGALVNREVRRLEVSSGETGSEETLFAELNARVRDVRVGPEGAIYILTNGTPGELMRVIRPELSP
jgi:glucose/arabinose dehydrogenase